MGNRSTASRFRLVVLLATMALASPATAYADVGYQGPQFTANAVAAPTGQKPQSKLWFHDGSWWGSLFVPAAGTNGEYRIHRLDPATHAWHDTGTPLDDRNSSEADVLWDGSHLYVASSSESAGVAEIRLFRFSYNACTRSYLLDSGFPVPIGSNAGPTEGVVLEKDTTGRLWVTFAKESTGEDGNVYVSHTNASDSDWVTPYVLPFPEAEDIHADDISALVAFEGKIGVMWSNQTREKMFFATHVDGQPDNAWTLDVAHEGPRSSDDHINLKSLQADPAGRVFAVIKTSEGDASPPPAGAPQVVLLVLKAGGWDAHTFGTVADDHTRPIVLTDQRRRKLYVFATSPTEDFDGSQTIYYKETSLDTPSFAAGVGQPFIQSSSGEDINNPTSTKQDLSNAPGLVVLASDTADYWHNMLSLGGESFGPFQPCPSGGGGGGSPQGTAQDRTRPVIRRLALQPAAFRRRRGTRINIVVSEPARVVLRAERRTRRRVRGRFRYISQRGRLSVNLPRGRGGLRFRGRLGGRRLRPGRYRMVAVAVDGAANRSAPRRAGFRILR
jgi:hypothetical protein